MPSTDLDAIAASAGETAHRQGRPAARAAARNNPRPMTGGRPVVIGRNGEQLTRRFQASVDPLHIDRADIEPGWDLQWISETVIGEQQDHRVAGFMNNGWRPVPANRYPGRFMKEGHDGPIRVNSMILMERPMVLTEDARAEDYRIAASRVRDISDRVNGVVGQQRGLTLDHPDLNRRHGRMGITQAEAESVSAAPLPLES